LILLIEDESSIRTVTRRTLETFGYRVMPACDGAEAIAVYARNQPDVSVVVTDMMMPVMDGAATIEVLRPDESRGKDYRSERNERGLQFDSSDPPERTLRPVKAVLD
jgi:CheY-like chemotaxis protein